ncbi:hypothetical protein LF95_15435 [Thalassospira sp. TSL5-1]|nr:hypothetical protein LF95_15435 [Thalassospira sp. TSL5-1]
MQQPERNKPGFFARSGRWLLCLWGWCTSGGFVLRGFYTKSLLFSCVVSALRLRKVAKWTRIYYCQPSAPL